MAVPTLRRPRDLTPWDPFEEFERTADRMARLLQQSFDADWTAPWPDGTTFRPAADLEETDDAFIVEMEVPGIAKGDIDLEVSGRRLTVTGERKERERTGVLRRRTRTVGRFFHEVVLPGDIETDAVTAQLRDGVLTVTAPKVAAERDRRRTIAIE